MSASFLPSSVAPGQRNALSIHRRRFGLPSRLASAVRHLSRPSDLETPTIGERGLVSRDSMTSVERADGTIAIERRSDRLAENKAMHGAYSNLAGYALRARNWTKASGAMVSANMIPSPWGVDRADQVVFPASAAAGITQAIVVSDGDSINISCYAKMASGTGVIRFGCSADGGTVSSDQIVRSDWIRLNWTVSITTGGSITFSILNGSDAAARHVVIWGIQVTKSKFALPLVFGSNLNKISKPLEFDDAAWTKTDLIANDSGGANGVDARVGVATTRLTATANDGSAQSATFAIGQGDVVQVCATIRKQTGTGAALLSIGDAVTYYNLMMDLNAGTISAGASADAVLVASEIIDDSGGWYRIRLRVHFGKAVAAAFAQLTLDSSGDAMDCDVLYGYIVEMRESMFETAPSLANSADVLRTAYYALNSNAQNSVGSNHGNWAGTESYQGAETKQNAAFFDGGEYITLGAAALSGKTFSLAFRIKFDSASIKAASSYTNIFSQATAGAAGRMFVSLYNNSGNYRLYWNDAGGLVFASAFLPIVGVEYDFVFVSQSGQNPIVYINGVSQTPIVASPLSADIQNTAFIIGRNYIGSATDLFGYIYDVPIYNGVVLTPTQVRERFTAVVAQARTLTYSETIAAESSAYPADATRIISTLQIGTDEQVALFAVFESFCGIPDIRSSESVILSATNASDSSNKRSMYFHRETETLRATDGETVLSIDSDSLRLAISSGKRLVIGYSGSRIIVIDESGNAWTTGDDFNQPQLDVALNRIVLGSKLDDGDYTDHFDGRIIASACLASPAIWTIDDLRAVARSLESSLILNS